MRHLWQKISLVTILSVFINQCSVGGFKGAPDKEDHAANVQPNSTSNDRDDDSADAPVLVGGASLVCVQTQQSPYTITVGCGLYDRTTDSKVPLQASQYEFRAYNKSAQSHATSSSYQPQTFEQDPYSQVLITKASMDKPYHATIELPQDRFSLYEVEAKVMGTTYPGQYNKRLDQLDQAFSIQKQRPNWVSAFAMLERRNNGKNEHNGEESGNQSSISSVLLELGLSAWAKNYCEDGHIDRNKVDYFANQNNLIFKQLPNQYYVFSKPSIGPQDQYCILPIDANDQKYTVIDGCFHIPVQQRLSNGQIREFILITNRASTHHLESADVFLHQFLQQAELQCQ